MKIRALQLVRFLVSLAALACAAASFAIPCEKNPDAEPVSEPYKGYSPTGYKGTSERDDMWFRWVRVVQRTDGSTRYVFRQPARRVARNSSEFYESIETVPLGGTAIGFIARHQGCAELLDRHGQRLGVEPFLNAEQRHHLASEPNSKTVLLLLTEPMGFADEVGWRYAIFKNGRLAAQSPRAYVRVLSNSLDLPTPTGTQLVAARPTDGIGAIQQNTLVEIVSPQWKGLGAIISYGAHGEELIAYWVADDGHARQLLDRGGKSLGVSGFDTAQISTAWWPGKAGAQKSDYVVVELINKELMSCRLFTGDMKPLLDVELPLVNGNCPTPNIRVASATFAYSDSAQRTHVYEIRPGPFLRPLKTNIEGALMHILDSGVMIIRIQVGERTLYHIVAPDGSLLNETDFEDFSLLGCGHVRLKTHGLWVTPKIDGGITEKLHRPFSC